MSKLINIMLIVSISTISYCKDEKKESTNLTFKDVKITEVTMEEKDFEKKFLNALNYAQNGNKDKALDQLDDCIQAYSIERDNTKGKAKSSVEKGLTSLKELKQNYAKYDMMDVNKEFNKTLYIAEKGITHKWIVEVEDYVVVSKNVSRSYPYFSKKLENFKIVVKEQKGQVKEWGEEISMKAEETETKLKNNEQVAEDQIADFYVSSKKWFEKNIL